MGTNSSLSFIIPNLLFGLCKGSRSLREYSVVFHEQFGYEVFGLELSFRLINDTNDRVVPDEIVISNKIGNTLIFEWTEGNDYAKKERQLDHYSKITKSDLINIAAVPPSAAQTFDVILVLRPGAVENFKSRLGNKEKAFPILVLDQQDQIIILSKAANKFQEDRTDTFFSQGIRTDRLPHYLPFSLETNQPKELVIFIVKHLESLLIKGITNISLPDFCRGFIPPWEFIGPSKQEELSKITKSLIHELGQDKAGGNLVKKISTNPLTWELYPDLFNINKKWAHKKLKEFIARVRGEGYQMSLDL